MKLCHMMCCYVRVITQIPHLGGTAPLKFGRAKIIQNLVLFRRTSDFECKYLWNGWRCQQAVNGVINYDPSGV